MDIVYDSIAVSSSSCPLSPLSSVIHRTLLQLCGTLVNQLWIKQNTRRAVVFVKNLPY